MAHICSLQATLNSRVGSISYGKLRVEEETADSPTLRNMFGGAFIVHGQNGNGTSVLPSFLGNVTVNNNFGMLPGPGGGIVKAITVGAAVLAAAGSWKEEIKAAGSYVGGKLAEAADAANECWDALWN